MLLSTTYYHIKPYKNILLVKSSIVYALNQLEAGVPPENTKNISQTCKFDLWSSRILKFSGPFNQTWYPIQNITMSNPFKQL